MSAAVPGEALPCAGGPERTHGDQRILKTRNSASAKISIAEQRIVWSFLERVFSFVSKRVPYARSQKREKCAEASCVALVAIGRDDGPRILRWVVKQSSGMMH